MLDLAALEVPTDSESGDAQHNPDVWELRKRIAALVAENRALREVEFAVRREHSGGFTPGVDRPESMHPRDSEVPCAYCMALDLLDAVRR